MENKLNYRDMVIYNDRDCIFIQRFLKKLHGSGYQTQVYKYIVINLDNGTVQIFSGAYHHGHIVNNAIRMIKNRGISLEDALEYSHRQRVLELKSDVILAKREKGN